MAVVERVLSRVPKPLRLVLIRHRELLKFAIVGGTTFLVDNGVWYLLKLSVLESRPTTAKGLAIMVATVVSYFLNREWSFRTRGGRSRTPEAVLFFIISGIAVALNLIPLYASRYFLHLEVPHVSRFVQEFADFASGSVIGMLIAMVFRFWAFKKWVFPDSLGRRRREDELDAAVD
ncbi:sugar translocase [Prauserella marina]|uniref:Putative flippase GtrA (Transmembrane translocase of bactoprenol-linked glucose) n=1 Tax=Prauserella marina TaxID=530584 RepID=A0A222VK27_9PSEU|nr:GtrA family protein [Prauserella marina]ASR34265.1 sugar translocase [Prauserella marina]PWV71968.1 putative flippase GtrA [Prauserella marina]SDD92164.1 Putative flippase GtrA (transmembrane translocase of bactoprenol-linked glucose) [Prauserella marina]